MSATAPTHRFISHIPKCEFVTLTKEMAQGLLLSSWGQRAIRKSHVQWLIQMINRGEFLMTNQGFGVDVEGRLFDGQHRLLALLGSQVDSIPAVIVYGLSRDAARAVDVGLTRTAADIMHFFFEKPEATRTVMGIVRFWGMQCQLQGARRKPTVGEMFDWYTQLDEPLRKVVATQKGRRCPNPVLAAIVDRLVQRPDDEQPLVFLDRVLEGAGLPAGSPELALRKVLFEGARKQRIESQTSRYNRTVSALNAFLEGRDLKRLNPSRKRPAHPEGDAPIP